MPAAKKGPVIDPQFEKMTLEEVKKCVEEQQQKLSDVKNRRNFVQQEREMINNYYQISKTEQQKIDDQIKVMEFEMENLSKNHAIQLEAFTNKFKHLEYDHETFIKFTLNENSKTAVKDEEDERENREKRYLDKKQELKTSIKRMAIENQTEIDKRKKSHEGSYENQTKKLENKLKKLRAE